METEKIGGHTVKNTSTIKSVNLTCVDCGLSSNFRQTFKDELCPANELPE